MFGHLAQNGKDAEARDRFRFVASGRGASPQHGRFTAAGGKQRKARSRPPRASLRFTMCVQLAALIFVARTAQIAMFLTSLVLIRGNRQIFLAGVLAELSRAAQ